MRIAALIITVLALLVGAALAFGLWRASALTRGLRARMAAAEAAALPAAHTLPLEIRDWAIRSGALTGHRRVILHQEAQMELQPDAGWKAITAAQEISLTSSGFLWRARQGGIGPLPLAAVIDSYTGGKGLLSVRLLGAFPVVTARGAQIDHAEAMRYLAELPWAPDAVLSNGDLRWQVLQAGRWQVTAPNGAAVIFTVRDGDPVRMQAAARPATDPSGQPTTYDWEGRFSDFQTVAGRRIPLAGEVGYIREGRYVPYFRGRITKYRVE